MYDLILEWKEFNVNLEMITALAKSLDANCVGSSADVNFRLHFLEQPSEEVIQDLKDHWELIDEEAEEVTSYKSNQDHTNDRDALKASAIAKLMALGLSQEEAEALKG